MYHTIRTWVYKKTHFEFFPMWLLYFPVVSMAVFYMIRYWFFNWFTFINPVLKHSGLFGHSKYALLKYLPRSYVLNTVLIKKESLQKDFVGKLEEFGFPLVMKPDNLYRGIGVKKIIKDKDFEILEKDLKQDDYVIQQMSRRKNEYAVFYRRFPDSEKGEIVSLVEKEFISFVGDGVSSLEDVVRRHPRGRFFMKKMADYYGQDFYAVPKKNTVISASFVGSHNKGTVFWDASDSISEKMSQQFHDLSMNIPSFYYGRYDVKADSLVDLERGDFDVMEVNGALAEPVHMYHPGLSIFTGYRILLSFWKDMFTIARMNRALDKKQPK